MAEQRRYSKFEVHKIMLISGDKPNEVVIINLNFSKKVRTSVIMGFNKECAQFLPIFHIIIKSLKTVLKKNYS